METLQKEHRKIQDAINLIRRNHQIATDRLEEINKQFPELLAASAMGEVELAALESLRDERSRLQAIALEDVEPACRLLHDRLKTISTGMQTELAKERAVDDEVYFRTTFNGVLESGLMKVDAWSTLEGCTTYPHHRKTVAKLKEALDEYNFKNLRADIISPEAYCASKGITLFSLDVSYGDLTVQPN